MVEQPQNFFPQPASADFAKKRFVYENTSPLYVSGRVTLDKDSKEYLQADLSGVPGLDPNVYGQQNFTGYITLPVGDQEFLTSSSVNGASIYNPYTQYNFADARRNTFHNPTFVDASKGGSAILEYRHNDPSIAGHFVVPIFRESENRNWYNVMERQGVIETPRQK